MIIYNSNYTMEIEDVHEIKERFEETEVNEYSEGYSNGWRAACDSIVNKMEYEISSHNEICINCGLARNIHVQGKLCGTPTKGFLGTKFVSSGISEPGGKDEN